jgi:hypothetical protein
MSNRRILLPILFLLAVALLRVGQLRSTSTSPFVEPACPAVLQQGELTLTIPAGSTSATVEQQFIRCTATNVQVTGGTMNRTPLIINAVVHHDQILVSANLLAPQPGPTDVTVWWRVD